MYREEVLMAYRYLKANRWNKVNRYTDIEMVKKICKNIHVSPNAKNIAKVRRILREEL